eukprot:GHVH01014030.1.p1 GENE.GHVH01014030.1~~GHVH01014030.1.p1  ORF type:complete len:388 (-),score=74.78 GHVH01014030.1:812-1975(-)
MPPPFRRRGIGASTNTPSWRAKPPPPRSSDIAETGRETATKPSALTRPRTMPKEEEDDDVDSQMDEIRTTQMAKRARALKEKARMVGEGGQPRLKPRNLSAFGLVDDDDEAFSHVVVDDGDVVMDVEQIKLIRRGVPSSQQMSFQHKAAGRTSNSAPSTSKMNYNTWSVAPGSVPPQRDATINKRYQSHKLQSIEREREPEDEEEGFSRPRSRVKGMVKTTTPQPSTTGGSDAPTEREGRKRVDEWMADMAHEKANQMAHLKTLQGETQRLKDTLQAATRETTLKIDPLLVLFENLQHLHKTIMLIKKNDDGVVNSDLKALILEESSGLTNLSLTPLPPPQSINECGDVLHNKEDWLQLSQVAERFKDKQAVTAEDEESESGSEVSM